MIATTVPYTYEKVWCDKNKYDDAECQYFEKLAKGSPNPPLKFSLAGEVAKARQHIKDSLNCMDGVIAAISTDSNKELAQRIDNLNQSTGDIWKVVNRLVEKVATLEARVKQLEGAKPASASAKGTTASAPVLHGLTPVSKDKAGDDDVDLFGSDSDEEESEEARKVREARLAAYAAKKSKKPELIAKSNIILDVKVWDDEVDLKQVEKLVREIKCDGLLWGASKLVPLAYGIHKLQISCVVEDEKVSVDWLQETIEALEDYVQSVDIAAFNKV